jgi:hypothetical protein
VRALCACDGGADRGGLCVQLEQDAGRRAVRFLHQCQQKVLGPDRLIAHGCLTSGAIDGILRPPRERHLAFGCLDAYAHHPDHRLAHLVVIYAERCQHTGRRPLALAQKGQQQVLGADVAVAKLARLLGGEVQGVASALCEVLVQRDVLVQADDRCLSIAARTDLRLAWRRS